MTRTRAQVRTNLHGSRASLAPSFVSSELAMPVTLFPIPPHPLPHICLIFTRAPPPHISPERTPWVSSAYVLRMCWRHARIGIFLQVMNYGGDVRVHASRPLHRLYAARMLSLVSLETLLGC